MWNPRPQAERGGAVCSRNALCISHCGHLQTRGCSTEPPSPEGQGLLCGSQGPARCREQDWTQRVSVGWMSGWRADRRMGRGTGGWIDDCTGGPRATLCLVGGACLLR